MARSGFLFFLLLFFFCQCACGQTVWTAYQYNVSFKVKNAGFNVSGKFTGLKCELLFSQDKLSASRIKGSVDAGTLSTGIALRDKHVAGEKYLDTEKYKALEASSTKIYAKGNDYAGLFNITIKGMTREVEIPFQFIQLGDVADFVGDFTINRRDFNVGGSSITMADDVNIHILIKARK